ncbi:hypothetical protein E8E12_000664 [Didymella heteroderae]|uniref:CFEM domain-containing protein n=1 Tax=Didymella heteroderae TaxID=1769908 RepID=A0A9P4WFC7_9PLEO|nr:hypothetical protein E8E12_000664 [Didymella heteroderae]
MKQPMILLAAVPGAATAQNLDSCAQLCVNNMNLIASTQFSCPAGDTACFCSQSNWAYGVRDCSRQACSEEQARQAVSYAAGLCQSVASTTQSGTSASPSTALTILNPTVASASGATASAASSAASSVASELSSGLSSIAESASSALASASGSLSSVAASATSAAGSTANSATSAAGSTAFSAVPSGAATKNGIPVAACLAAAAWLLI